MTIELATELWESRKLGILGTNGRILGIRKFRSEDHVACKNSRFRVNWTKRTEKFIRL